MSSASAGRRQPDLLCPQNTFPPYLDPSGIAGSPLHAGANNFSTDGDRLEGDPPLFDAHFDNGDPLQQQVAAEVRVSRQNRCNAVIRGHFLLQGQPVLVLISSHQQQGAGIAQWPEHQTLNQKVAGASPGRSSRNIFFSRVSFLCRLISVSVPPLCYHSST